MSRLHHDSVHLPVMLAAEQAALLTAKDVPTAAEEAHQATPSRNLAEHAAAPHRKGSLRRKIIRAGPSEYAGEDTSASDVERTIKAIVLDRCEYPWHDEQVQQRTLRCKVDACIESFAKESALR